MSTSCHHCYSLRPLPILGVGMVVLGLVLLLLLLTVQNKTKVDPLFYGKKNTHFNICGDGDLLFFFSLLCVHVFVQYLQSFPSPAWSD